MVLQVHRAHQVCQDFQALLGMMAKMASQDLLGNRENLENQGSQARRVPEAYRVSKDREETQVPQVPGGNQVRQVLLGARDHQGRMVIPVP